MKMHILFLPSNSSGSVAIHRAVEGRFGDSKEYGHRYERRKVREYLRHRNGQDSLDGDSALDPVDRFQR